MLTETAKWLLVKILAIYSAYLFVRFHICILTIKLKTTELSGYYAYTVNRVFSPPLNSSLVVCVGSVCDLVTWHLWSLAP